MRRLSTIPTRDGVTASRVVLPPGPWPRMLDFLQQRFADIPPQAWHRRLAQGLVLDESGAPLAADAPYRAGSCLYYYREVPSEPEPQLRAEVLFRDEHLLVADKPHFLQVMPAGRYVKQTLVVQLQRQFADLPLTALHRLDRGTAGLVLFSVNPATRARYQALFRTHTIGKVYEALAPTLPDVAFPLTRRTRLVEGTPFIRMREAEGPANTETLIDVIENRGALSLYRLRPVTGKKHQLRVHLAALGAPILNDPLYPEVRPDQPDDPGRPLKLLARALEFTDPVSGAARMFVSRRTL